MTRLADKVAIITGAASGIGAATAWRLADEGAAVIIADIAEHAGREVAAKIVATGGQAEFVRADVSAPRAWQALRERVIDRFGGLDLLCSNASVQDVVPAHEMDPDTWNRGLAVNLTPLFLGVRTFIDDLAGRRGSIVAISSVHANFGLPGFPYYAAAKGGLCALARQLAAEYGRRRVRVNTILPGPILTPVWDGVDEAGRQQSAQATALGRMGHPDEVAAAVAFLASDDASYITGTSLLVDGGWSITKESQ